MSRGLFLSSISRIALTADECAADSGSSSSFSSLPVCPHSIGPDLFIMSEIEHLYKTPAHVPILSPLPLCLLPVGKRTTKGPANVRRASRSAGPSVIMVMTLLNCPALGCRARRLDDGESDNADKPGAPAKNQFRVASRTRDLDEVMASQTDARPHSRSPCRLPAGANFGGVESIPAMDIMGSMHNVCTILAGNQYIIIILRLSWIHQRVHVSPIRSPVWYAAKPMPPISCACATSFSRSFSISCDLLN